MRYGLFLLIFLIIAAASARSQEWEPIGAESFEALAGVHDCSSVEDGGLLLIQYPGVILRSTDTGGTWSEVFRSGTMLTGFERMEHISTEIVAYGDSGYAVRSLDSGRTWSVAAPPPSPLLEKEGEKHSLPPALYPLPIGTNSTAFADSSWFAVGEPGLISVWDTMQHRWRELHRAPYTERQVGLQAPIYTPSGHAIVEFHTPAYGAIALGNQMFFTFDSSVTWKRSVVPDTSGVSSLWLSDTFALAGMSDGSLYEISHSGGSFLRCDSILYANAAQIWSSEPPAPEKSILQIGWMNEQEGTLFALTDSVLYSLSGDLHASSSYVLPLRPGERSVNASFPNAYVGFLLTDSTKRIDTLTSDGRDTTIVQDTSYIYRSLDGGSTWALALNNIPGLTAMTFVNVHRGCACGANGLIMRTDDSGSTWSRAWSMTKQPLHGIRFVNDSVGYAVGDSGTVLQTVMAGRLWRALPPEPLFTHPTTRYESIAFPNAHTVYAVAQNRGDRSAIKIPASVRFNRRRSQRNTLSVSARPDPSAGPITFDVRIAGTPSYGAMPELQVTDLSGKSYYETSAFHALSTNEWNVEIDLSFLQPGPYTALVTLGGQDALVKFLIQH